MNFDHIIIITDDGIHSENTNRLMEALKSIDQEVELFVTNNPTSAKSNSISLVPFRFSELGNITIFDAFPADCLLYNIMNFPKKVNPKDTLFIFGINEHNHFGYSNFVSSTTCLLLLAKHFDFKAVAVSSEIILDFEFILSLFNYILNFLGCFKNYYSFNINEKSLTFGTATISRGNIDKYEKIETHRGPFLLITFNKKPKSTDFGTDIYYQSRKKNYIVKVF